MKLTRDYIMSHRTKRGAWTQPQIEALGLSWPPPKGWIDQVVGKEISYDRQIAFEAKLTKRQRQKGLDLFIDSGARQ